jgi:hypothetical protein
VDVHAVRTPEGRGVNVQLRITRHLLHTVRLNLARPHPFAYERVGFLAAGLSSRANDLWVLVRSYRAVADGDYLHDHSVGAMMGPEAIRKALQWAMSENVAVFHVHAHSGRGHPRFSGLDLREQAKFVPNFFHVAPQCPHGALVLSDVFAYGHIWLSEDRPYDVITRFSEVGVPLKEWSPL